MIGRPAKRLAAALAGLTLALLAAPLVTLIDLVLPTAGSVRSAGTGYPGFAESYEPALRGLGLLIAGAFALPLPKIPATSITRWCRAAAPVVVALTALVYAWLAYPHNGFPSNSRIHWVDIFFDRADNFFYALARVPHLVFYGAPWALQGLNGALNAWLVTWVVRRATGRTSASVGAGVTYLVASVMLLFANSAEDVQLSVTALLLVCAGIVGRRARLTGAALFIAMLARPQFLLAVPALVLAEYVVGRGQGQIDEDGDERVSPIRSLLLSASTFIPLFIAWHAYLHAIDSAWLLTDGRVVSTGLTELTPRPIDGYTIAPFSGAYVLHLLWLVPVPMWLALASSRVAWSRMTASGRRLVIFVLTFTTATILLNEVVVLFYFNIRYLAYLFPLLLIAAWTSASSGFGTSGRWWVVPAGLVLTFSAAVYPHQELTIRGRVTASPIAASVDRAHELREILGETTVATTFQNRGQRNFLAYLVRRPYDEIIVIEDVDAAPSGSFVVTLGPSDTMRGVVYEHEGLLVLAPEPST